MPASPRSRAVKTAGRSLAALTAAGTAVLVYSLIEAHAFTLRQVVVPVLPEGEEPLRILHVSDLHMMPRQRDKQEWLRSLGDLMPDFVVGTGDFLSHPDSVGPVVRALGPLLDLPGAFVLGSNDYYRPVLGNPLGYLAGPSERPRERTPDLPWEDLISSFKTCGWVDLDNRRATIVVGDRVVDARGVDDPHIDRDDYASVSGPFDPAADLQLAVTHAPYLRVIDAMAADGAELILAGHTHGGQVCVPGYGALVTNCDLDTRQASGLSQHEGSWLHVSAGMGTNPFTPVRLACRPEATLLTLVSEADSYLY